MGQITKEKQMGMSLEDVLVEFGEWLKDKEVTDYRESAKEFITTWKASS